MAPYVLGQTLSISSALRPAKSSRLRSSMEHLASGIFLALYPCALGVLIVWLLEQCSPLRKFMVPVSVKIAVDELARPLSTDSINGFSDLFPISSSSVPALFLLGTHNWTGGNNLSFKTNGLYLSFTFMYYIRRRYGPWWEKYNYLLNAGFDVGVAVSGIIQTLAFSFGSSSIAINWWGNTVATAGLDYELYQNTAALLPVPKQGYFGLSPNEYPMHF